MDARQPPLNVLQVASSLHDWGGIERYVVYLSRGLAERGHRVVAACPPRSAIRERLNETVVIEMRRKLDFQAFAAYLRLFRENRFDVVHGHFSHDFFLPALAARMRRQPLTVMTRHVAVRWAPAKARLYASLWKRVVPVSDAVERVLVDCGVPARQLMPAKAGAPVPATQVPRDVARGNLGLTDGDFAIGSFGRLAPEKGVGVLIDAIFQVPNGRACIFGLGPQERALRSRASSTVSFHGRVADIGDSMAAMDVVAIPSVWEESFPYSALEAMALGRPIVASRIGGLPEMVEEGLTGRLFKPGDPKDLAKVLREMGADRTLCMQMGEAGRARYEREFTVEHMVDRMLGVYLRTSE